MTKIERRHTTVQLYAGNYQNDLNVLFDQMMAARLAEESGAAPQRAGTRSQAVALAKQYDALLAEANEAAINVDVYEISNIDWQKLADEHPPRDGEDGDKQSGVNMKTFPAALLEASLPKPAPVDLNELARVHYIKLETAAWNLHNGDDALPKFSAVSFLKAAKEAGSSLPDSSG